MTVKWHDLPNGQAEVLCYVEEVAPSMRPGAPKHEKQTWFIVNIVPDGICMNCRQRPGILEPNSGYFGYYACDDCRQQTYQAIIAEFARRRRVV